jgi:hypothetical protein
MATREGEHCAGIRLQTNALWDLDSPKRCEAATGMPPPVWMEHSSSVDFKSGLPQPGRGERSSGLSAGAGIFALVNQPQP